MRKLEINDYFREAYLRCGNTYDNFVFEGCPKELLEEAYSSLQEEPFGIKSCTIKLTRSIEEVIEKMLEEYADNDFYQTIFFRSYINSKVLQKILERFDNKNSAKKTLIEKLIKDFECGERCDAKELYRVAPFMHEIIECYRKYGKFEVNFILEDTANIYMQRAINNFISSRAPFSVKLFTNLDKLPSYRDEGGQVIECPHDYSTHDINDFIKIDDKIL